jgi:hypothetical protein
LAGIVVGPRKPGHFTSEAELEMSRAMKRTILAACPQAAKQRRPPRPASSQQGTSGKATAGATKRGQFTDEPPS